MGVKVLNSLEEFHTVIKSGKPVLIDFWATWCGPCKAISPVFEALSGRPEFEGLEFYKVDVDEQDSISQEVGVRAMPTFMLFKDGDKVNDLVGAHPGKLTELVGQAKTLVV